MYTCEICTTSFEKYNSFCTHCNRKHKISHASLRGKYFPKQQFAFQCSRCERSFASYDSLRKHTGHTHRIPGKKFYIEQKLGGIVPTCKCGCGTPTQWIGHGFRNYKAGHHARIKNNWSKDSPYFEKSSKKSAETLRKHYADGTIKNWCAGLTKETSPTLARMAEMSRKENNPERARKISATQKKQFAMGIRSNIGKNNPMYGKHHSIETIKKIYSHKKMNKLEKKVADMLDMSGLKYYFQFFIVKNGICKSYDFKIKHKNLILEIDGDYWHGGPSKKQYCKSVDQVKENDKEKEKLAAANGYTLLRFWESDFKKDPQKVMKTILDALDLDGKK